VREMEDINQELPEYDVGIVVGANDIVNPATQTDPSSPIYGMPAIEIWRCKTCVVLKRSMATGYSGVENPLFYEDNVRMLFGDAKQSMDAIFAQLQQSQASLGASGAMGAQASGEEARRQQQKQQQQIREEFPPAKKILGIVRERTAGEKRVSITPSLVPKLRRLGFSLLLEAGAGSAAGFTDEEYMAGASGAGVAEARYIEGVQIAESAVEVLKQADVVLKVTAPLLEELHVLQPTQMLVGFWNMFDAPEGLHEALGQSPATFINLGLIPRISRAQKLDALTSMANIAGYRAVIDSFNRLPRFSRSSVTACGAVPPAKVFVIGTGVAGLSAIATAHSLGAKVYANDVRDAAREQVQSMGAEFIPINATGVAGEGVGGYATEMGESFKNAQLATYARIIPEMDVVIATAMIPNRAAPVLITEEMLRSMKHGSVVCDLAAQTGGNCESTERDKVVITSSGVTVIGKTGYASEMPAQASEMLGNNFIALLETLGGAVDWGDKQLNDPVIRPALVPQPILPHTQSASSNQAAASSTDPPAGQQLPLSGGDASALLPPEPALPSETHALLKWMQEHRTELAFGVGAATLLLMGVAVDIPEEQVMHIGYFVLSCLIGHFTVAGVTPALHTPLISVTNAISGIIVMGGMLQLSGPHLQSGRVAFALATVFLSSVNIVGGFAVTQRMLEMFRR